MSNTKASTNKIDVAYVANLCRLHLTNQETQIFQDQLEQIVGYVQKINQIDLTGIEPTSHACLMQNVFREDENKPGLDRKTVLENAPLTANNQFKVPKIME